MSKLDDQIEILQGPGATVRPVRPVRLTLDDADETGHDGTGHHGAGRWTGADDAERRARFEEIRTSFAATARSATHAARHALSKGPRTMGIFSRTRDIIAANFNDLLDKAEDPSKMIRLIILEMEETLVEVRTSSARTIADQKELKRHVDKLQRLQGDWGEKAQLALSKGREDLARAALLEKRKAADLGDQLTGEIAVLDDALRAYEDDIEKLQSRLREARSRQSSIVARLQSAENRVKLRTLLSSERVDEAMLRFDQLERRVDYAEGRAEALSLADNRGPTLSEEIAALAEGDHIEAELAAMKQAMNGSDSPRGGETQ